MTLILSGTEGVSDVDGSAATPAVRGADANTGIFFPAADTIAFAEGGTEVARITDTGAWSFGASGTATGTSGQALISAGSGAAPAWGALGVGAISATGTPSASTFLRGDGAWAGIDLTTVTQSVISTNTSAVSGTYYTLTASLTLTLPGSPSAGNFVAFSNRSGTTTAVIARNGLNIMTLAEDLVLNSAQARGLLVYTGATNGWVLFNT